MTKYWNEEDYQNFGDEYLPEAKRTQVRSLRLKTGIGSMRLLVQRVASLPPMVPMSLTLRAPASAHPHL